MNYLVHFGNEQYEEAWTEAQKIHVEGLFWHPLFRGSILGKLGRIKEAKVYINELLQIKPDFLKRPHEYIKLLFVLDEHVEMIWDGLQKAGLEQVEYRSSLFGNEKTTANPARTTTNGATCRPPDLSQPYSINKQMRPKNETSNGYKDDTEVGLVTDHSQAEPRSEDNRMQK
jgi:hypothetical protein